MAMRKMTAILWALGFSMTACAGSDDKKDDGGDADVDADTDVDTDVDTDSETDTGSSTGSGTGTGPDCSETEEPHGLCSDPVDAQAEGTTDKVSLYYDGSTVGRCDRSVGACGPRSQGDVAISYEPSVTGDVIVWIDDAKTSIPM